MVEIASLDDATLKLLKQLLSQYRLTSDRGPFVACVAPQRLLVACVLDADLVAGSSALATVSIVDPEDPGAGRSPSNEKIKVYSWMVESGKTFAAGTQLVLAFLGRWEVISANTCPE